MSTTPYANSLFEQPWWLDAVAPGQWDEALVTDANGSVMARMPYVKTGNRITMPPLTQNLGIWMAPEIRDDCTDRKMCSMNCSAALTAVNLSGKRLAR